MRHIFLRQISTKNNRISECQNFLSLLEYSSTKILQRSTEHVISNFYRNLISENHLDSNRNRLFGCALRFSTAMIWSFFCIVTYRIRLQGLIQCTFTFRECSNVPSISQPLFYGFLKNNACLIFWHKVFKNFTFSRRNMIPSRNERQ